MVSSQDIRRNSVAVIFIWDSLYGERKLVKRPKYKFPKIFIQTLKD